MITHSRFKTYVKKPRKITTQQANFQFLLEVQSITSVVMGFTSISL